MERGTKFEPHFPCWEVNMVTCCRSSKCIESVTSWRRGTVLECADSRLSHVETAFQTTDETMDTRGLGISFASRNLAANVTVYPFDCPSSAHTFYFWPTTLADDTVG